MADSSLLQCLGDTGTLRSISRTISFLAARFGDRDAVVVEDGDSITFTELDKASNRLARALASLNVSRNDFVTVALPNSIEFIVVCFAAWKLGATPQLLSYRLPFRERDEIVRLAKPRIVIGVPQGSHDSTECLPAGFTPDSTISDAPLPDVFAKSWKAPTSGGSTGRPKVIVSGKASLVPVDSEGKMLDGLPTMGGGIQEGVKLVPGPLYHSGPFNSAFEAILAGGTLVVMTRFDAAKWLLLVSKHNCDWSYLVPTMMKRIWDVKNREQYNLASLKMVFHTAAPCPPWLKEAWCKWLGPEKIVEMYGMSEGLLWASIRGDEWLKRRRNDGTNLVGRLGHGAIRVCDADGAEVPPLTLGEIWVKSSGSYQYIGAKQESVDGWETLGDVGMVDAEHYIYLGDRKKDMMIVGGVNIFPAEVEAAVEEHPMVSSVAVVGLPDADLGQRLHAIVHLSGAVSDEELMHFVAERLVKEKVPRSWERVDTPVRGDDGKVRRSGLAAERASKL